MGKCRPPSILPRGAHLMSERGLRVAVSEQPEQGMGDRMPTEREIEAAAALLREGWEDWSESINFGPAAEDLLTAAEAGRYQCSECRGEGRLLHHESVDQDRCVACGGSGFDPETTEWVCNNGTRPGAGRIDLCWFSLLPDHYDDCGWYPKRVRLGP